MKKITIVSIASLLFLSICSTVAYFLQYLKIDNAWILLGIGVATLIVSGVLLAIFYKTSFFQVVCFLVNSVALGFCIRAWYVFRAFNNSLLVMLLVSVLSLVYLLIFYSLLYIPFINRHFKIYIWVFLVLSVIAYIFVMAFTKTTYVSTFGYYLIIEIAFIFALCAKTESLKELIFNIILSTYSVLIVAIIIAIIMLCGDGLDGFDFGVDGTEVSIDSPKDQMVSKKERKPQEYDFLH